MRVGTILSIDYMKAGSMLYIVGYWHLLEYLDGNSFEPSPVASRATLILLGLFVMISGFLMGASQNVTLPVREFYRRRLLRIFPLYAVAVILFMYLGINEPSTSMKSLFGIAMFWQPAPLTLWFVTMILTFYLITPLLLRHASNLTSFVLVAISLLAGVTLFHVMFRTVDTRLLLYFPCYCLGIYIACHGIAVSRAWLSGVIVAFLIGATASFSMELNSWMLNQLKDGLMVVTGSYLIFFACQASEQRLRKLTIVGILSYISFSMYLFHRPVFSLMKAAYFPSGESMQFAYLVMVCLPVVAIVSWILQWGYDRMASAMARKVGPF